MRRPLLRRQAPEVADMAERLAAAERRIEALSAALTAAFVTAGQPAPAGLDGGAPALRLIHGGKAG